jgi:hypothetical protein
MTDTAKQSERLTVAEFARTLCVGQEYDSCISSPCRYASMSGCQHPRHPKRAALKEAQS